MAPHATAQPSLVELKGGDKNGREMTVTFRAVPDMCQALVRQDHILLGVILPVVPGLRPTF